jgi:hypothetical protein
MKILRSVHERQKKALGLLRRRLDFYSGSATPMSANTLPELGVTGISGFLAMLHNPLWRERAEFR